MNNGRLLASSHHKQLINRDRLNLIILYREGGEGGNTQDITRMRSSKMTEIIIMNNKDMTQSFYTYEEALEIVEKFMIESRIRKYCETVCQGRCCPNYYEVGKGWVKCKDSDQSCLLTGRRLPCSIYLCDELRELLPNNKILSHLDRVVKNTMMSIMRLDPYFLIQIGQKGNFVLVNVFLM